MVGFDESGNLVGLHPAPCNGNLDKTKTLANEIVVRELMTQWHVELTCKRQELLIFLSTTLQEPACTVKAGNTDCYSINPGAEPRLLVVRETSGYYLLSSEFTSLTDARDVRTRAIAMLPFLNALVKLKISTLAPPLEIDDVFRLDAEGRMIWEIATATATFSSLESRLQKAAGQPLNFTAIWLPAQKHQAVDEVLHYLANETNWFNLYKAYEVIKKETRRLENSQKMKRGTFDNVWTGGRWLDFEESANKERHSSLVYQPRQGVTIVYMSLDEAAQFVSALFFQWLQTK